MAYFTVTDNTLRQTADLIEKTAAQVLDGAGERFWNVARQECPISDIDEPGYVHLVETINWDVDQETTFSQIWVTFFVEKSYAMFVNNGTSRMPPRPFFDMGVAAVSDGIDEIIHDKFRFMMLGHMPVSV
jgi:hypothetical protein